MLQTSWKTALFDISEDDDLTAEVDLGFPCDTLIVRIPTITSAAISVKVAEKSGGTFQDLYITVPSTGAPVKVATTAATTAHIVQLPLGGFQYIKLASGAGQAADRSCSVCGVRG
jgi:hypothetical protein